MARGKCTVSREDVDGEPTRAQRARAQRASVVAAAPSGPAAPTTPVAPAAAPAAALLFLLLLPLLLLLLPLLVMSVVRGRHRLHHIERRKCKLLRVYVDADPVRITSRMRHLMSLWGAVVGVVQTGMRPAGQQWKKPPHPNHK
ncbi:hypothetical protein Sjap_010982 [Stephania japonica]|uniref:Uncharacterized protein n=1 Tax=Stephania japonica TaxID=461633 RepID=A0AAP0P703_9MAGN